MRRKGVYTSLILSLLIIASISYGSSQARAQTEQEPPDTPNEYLPVLTNSSFYLPSREYMTDSVIGPDSSVYAIGTSLDDRVIWQPRIAMAKWDGMGNLIWGGVRNVSGSPVGYGVCVADDCLYVAASNASDALVEKWSTDGRLLQSFTIDTGLWDDAFAIAADSDGNMYVCGYRQGWVQELQDWIQERILLRLTPDGEIEWLKAFSSPYAEFRQTNLVLHPDGYLLVRDFPYGVSRWHLNGTYDPFDTSLNTTSFQGMALDNEGNIYTHDRYVGEPLSWTGLQKWSSDGELVWSRFINRTSAGIESGGATIESISVSHSGTVFILADTESYYPWNRSLLCLSSEGELLWRRRVLDHYWGGGIDIHCGSSGLLYVCGTMWNGMYVRMLGSHRQTQGNIDLALGVFNPENSPTYLLGRVLPALTLCAMGLIALSSGYYMKRRKMPILGP